MANLKPFFYGQQAEMHSFFRVPKLLFKDDQYKHMSAEAKLAYGIMLDKASLSFQNGWLDEENRVYIIYTHGSLMEDMNCAKEKANKIMRELENNGLILKRKQGLCKPNLIYVLNFAAGLENREPSAKVDIDGMIIL